MTFRRTALTTFSFFLIRSDLSNVVFGLLLFFRNYACWISPLPMFRRIVWIDLDAFWFDYFLNYLVFWFSLWFGFRCPLILVRLFSLLILLIFCRVNIPRFPS